MAGRGRFHHGFLKEAAVDAALAIVERDGPDALTLREVAKATGVNHRALYRHFADRDEIAMSVAAIGFDRLADRIALAIRGEPDATRHRRRLFAAYVAFAFDEARLYALMFGTPMSGIDGRAFLEHPTLAPSVAKVTEQAATAFRRAEDPPGFSVALRDRVMVAWGTAHGLVDLWRRGALRARSPSEAKAYILDLLTILDPVAGPPGP